MHTAKKGRCRFAALDAIRGPGFSVLPPRRSPTRGSPPLRTKTTPLNRATSRSRSTTSTTVASRPQLLISTQRLAVDRTCRSSRSTARASPAHRRWTRRRGRNRRSRVVRIGNVQAREVVVAAGALHSPALLLRAGIGPGHELSALGIPVVADRPGRRRESPGAPASRRLVLPQARCASRPRSTSSHFCWGPLLVRPRRLLRNRYVRGCRQPRRLAPHGAATRRLSPLGEQSLFGWKVSLSSANHDLEPAVDFNMLGRRRDARRMVDGLKLLERLYRHPAMRSVAAQPFPTNYSERARDLAVVNWSNWFQTVPTGLLLDGPSPLRHEVMRRRVTGGLSLSDDGRPTTQGSNRSSATAVNGTWQPAAPVASATPMTPSRRRPLRSRHRRSRPPRRRRLGHARHPLRQHQPPDNHARRKVVRRDIGGHYVA